MRRNTFAIFANLTLFATLSANLSNLHAIDLNQICQNGSTDCNISTIYGEVTNNDSFIFSGSGRISLDTNGGIDTFINYGTLSNTGAYERSFYWSGGHIRNIINYGTMGGIGGNRSGTGGTTPMSVTNYGLMFGGIDTSWGTADITINNFGVIGSSSNMGQTRHLAGGNYSFIIKNYALIITQDSTTFNVFRDNAVDNSQVVLQGGSMRFSDSNAKVILDFGGDFSFGEAYLLNKLFVDTSGNNALNVDFSRLTTRSELYTLTQSGNNFIVNLADSKTAGYSMVGSLHKSNIKTMNNLFLQSNNMIYPHKYKKKKFSANGANLPSNNYRKVRGISNLFYNPTSSLRESALADSWQSTNKSNESQWIASALPRNDGFGTNPLESNELFFYNNEWLLSRDNANRSVQSSPYSTTYHTNMQSQANDSPSKSRYTTPKAKPKPCAVYKCVYNPQQPNAIAQVQQPQTNAIRPQPNAESKSMHITPKTTQSAQPTRIAQATQSAQPQSSMLIATNLNDMDCPPLENPCGPYKCIYNINSCKPKPKVEPKPQPKIEPKVVEQPKIEPKIQPQPKPIQVIRPTMPPPPKVEPKIEPKPIVQPKEQPKVMPKVEQPKPEPKVVKVESKPTPPKPKVIIQDPYYFILTPYIAHNFFYEAGRYNLSGLEYGFITAFSGKITEEHILGLHFAFSYGSLKDSVDSIFNIASMNIMGGLNYKFDITTDMYLKARVDIFYFLNQVQSTMTSGNIMKPNNLGFGASVAYGKEWDFDKNGILGLEVALDYKGLMSPNILTQNGGDSTINESFNKALYNMLYVDLGLNYDKYFESSVGKWGLDTGLGVKVNATANALAKSSIRLNNIRDIDMVLDNDMFLAYLNVGGSYLLESKDFDMEFSLAYYGNYGDRSMSNAGGFEWRVYW